jgi:2,4-dienoyl-CoA reductase-like NADH-dependent reductase (Old Yellow Enzyme family)
MHLLRQVEVYLRRSGMAPTRFGREVVRDPRFVFDLRQGREPRAPTVRRVTDFLEQREGAGR